MPTPKKLIGRPMLFSSPEQMQEKIDKYFEAMDLEGRPYTIPGLALYIGFAQRTQLADYANDHPDYSDAIARARSKIEVQRVEMLIRGDTRNVRGQEFDLKNNFGYSDKQEVDFVGDITSNIIRLPPKRPISEPPASAE